MLHELIMCLLGKVGGLFQLTTVNNKVKIKLVENFEFIHPAEIEVCNKLAELGNCFRQISQFVDDYSFGKSFHEKPLKYGLYLTTFCDALNIVVLTPYRTTVSQLEYRLLKDHYLNATFLQTHMEHHYTLFHSLCNMLDELQSKGLHGCQIVDLIYRFSISGNYLVKSTFNKILVITLEVMYKQMRDWMIYGNLNDKYDEFFIFYDQSSGGAGTGINQTALQSTKVEYDNEFDETATANTIAMTTIGATASQMPTLINDFERFSIGSRFSSSYSKFNLNSRNLPLFINLKVANKILFAGELLQLFQAKYLNEIHSDGGIGVAGNTTNNESTINMIMSLDKVQYVSDLDKSLKSEFSLMNEQLNAYSKEIYELSQREFAILDFAELVTKIRNHVSESVWSLIVEKYNLFNEFVKLKDMFLIGRGELFATFLESSKEFLDRPIGVNFEYNINAYFLKSISRMLLDEEQWLTKFRIIVADQNPLKKNAPDNGWNRIGLGYRVEWPFHSLITQKVLKKYNEIFSYLLSIRRAQSELNQCFLIQMRANSRFSTSRATNKNKTTAAATASAAPPAKSQIHPKIWLSRNHMSFLIDNLQFYLQADVLETQFADLNNKIKMSKDFEQIRYAHDTFLTKIQSQSFLLNKTVYNCLSEIMDSCIAFSEIVKKHDQSGATPAEFPYDPIENCIKNFQLSTHVLYKTFKSLEKRQMGSHLEQLLTRINFNNYLSDNDGLFMK